MLPSLVAHDCLFLSVNTFVEDVDDEMRGLGLYTGGVRCFSQFKVINDDY